MEQTLIDIYQDSKLRSINNNIIVSPFNPNSSFVPNNYIFYEVDINNRSMRQISPTNTPNLVGEKYVYLFSYGSNNFEQICQRLNVTNQQKDVMWKHSKPGRLAGCKRAFFNASSNWGGATATVVCKDTFSNSNVYGIIVPIPVSKIPIMDVAEAAQNNQKYMRITKKVNVYNGDAINCIIYVHNPVKVLNHKFKPVTHDYLEAIAKTLRDYRLLKGSEVNKEYDIDVRRIYANGKVSREVSIASIKPTPELRLFRIQFDLNFIEDL